MTAADIAGMEDSIISLLEKKYYVIDWTRFEVFSKDCDKELITWRDGDENDPVVHQIVNPVQREPRDHHDEGLHHGK
jgi:hypothetical protein